VAQKLVARDAQVLPDAVLEACFRGMAMGDRSAMDAGPHRSDLWLTAAAKAWFMNQQAAAAAPGGGSSSPSHGAQTKLSKNQFTAGLKQVLGLHVPWANADALWRRVLKEFPAEPSASYDAHAAPRATKTAAALSPLSSGGRASRYAAPSPIGRDAPPSPAFPPRGSALWPASERSRRAATEQFAGDVEVEAEEPCGLTGDGSLLFGADWRGQVRDLRRSANEQVAPRRALLRKGAAAAARPKSAPLGSGARGDAAKVRASATGAAGAAAAAADDVERALLKAVAGASHLSLHQFTAAFRPPQNAPKPGRRSSLASGGGVRSLERRPDTPLNLHARGGSTDWMNEAFAKVMQAMDADRLLLHEAFFVFDVNGDGVVSIGEFVRTLHKTSPPLNLDKTSLFSLFTAMDHGGRRAVHMTEVPPPLDSRGAEPHAVERQFRSCCLMLGPRLYRH
jgi:hypothetical protein